MDSDFWKLTRAWLDEPSYGERQIESTRKRLQELLYFRSSEWSAESNRRYRAIVAASDDKRFQAFKVLIPGLAPQPRSLKRKSNAEGTQNG
ncbi:hypothetical protein [Paraburkholderia phosphatilytica]|uniref:hypothetical protein n=1 Tax=Paraburkholderia phosphatilytica TaxID=2282883 RepID=UPI000E555D2A|nr:hypothetical protein [Paraburkholderia phosphatilytica]